MAVPLLFPLVPRTQRHRIGMVWMVMAAVVVAAAIALASFHGPRDQLMGYIRTHLIPALQGRRELAKSKFGIVRYLVGGILARMAVILAPLWWIRLRSGKGMPRVHTAGWFFLLIGLAASLPIAASPTRTGHYFVPSVPFFAMSAAAFALPAIGIFDQLALGRWGERMPLIAAAGLLATAISVVAFHGTLDIPSVLVAYSQGRLIGCEWLCAVK